MSHARRITKNSLFLLALTLSNYAAGLLLFPFISRTLSVEGFGLVGFGIACALVFQSVVEYGFMISATTQISSHREDSGRISLILSTTMLAKAILAAIACLIFVASAAFIPPIQANPLVMGLFFLSGIAAAMVPDFYFRGIERMKAIAVRAVLTRVFSVAVTVMLVRDDSDIPIIPASLLGGNLVAAAVGFAYISRDGIRLHRVNIKLALADIREGLFLFLARAAVIVNQSLGTFILGFRYSPTSPELGLFTAAVRIASAGEMLITPISDSLYPHMIKKRDYTLFRKVYLTGVVGWLAGCTIVFIYAPDICSLLLGENYREAGGALRILVSGTFIAFSSNLFGYNALAPIGLMRHANIALIFSLAINVATFVLLYLADALSLTSVASVVALANFSTLAYRATVFYRHRHLIEASSNRN